MEDRITAFYEPLFPVTESFFLLLFGFKDKII